MDLPLQPYHQKESTGIHTLKPLTITNRTTVWSYLTDILLQKGIFKIVQSRRCGRMWAMSITGLFNHTKKSLRYYESIFTVNRRLHQPNYNFKTRGISKQRS